MENLTLKISLFYVWLISIFLDGESILFVQKVKTKKMNCSSHNIEPFSLKGTMFVPTADLANTAMNRKAASQLLVFIRRWSLIL